MVEKKGECGPLIRAAVLQEYSATARAFGLDDARMLKRHSISVEDVTNPDGRIPFSTFADLLDDSAAQAHYPAFGLRMAINSKCNVLGPLSLLLQFQPTVRDIIEQIVSHNDIASDGWALRTDLCDDVCIIGMDYAAEVTNRQAIEFIMAATYASIRDITAGRWLADSIQFRHSAPGKLALHRGALGIPILFDSEFDAIVCDSAALGLRNPRADSAMACYARRYIAQAASGAEGGSLSGQVRCAISALLASGDATMERVAERLRIHPRALQRSLSKEAKSFGAVLNDTRRDLALRYLASADTSITQIADLLGYNSIIRIAPCSEPAVANASRESPKPLDQRINIDWRGSRVANGQARVTI